MQSDMGQMEWRATRQYTGARNVVRAPPKKWCRCPTQFTPKITEDGECECSCIEQDQDCSKLQSGKGYLSRVDRICIMTQQCSAPTCKFGEYVTSQGKCPKKKDAYLGQLPSNANLPQPSNLYYPQRRS
ncbi:hypothetical protein QAD02_000911 [Eretmocerus hayati]|uniref:Uncharacterized protein n=1 Tax=Eretmocerus hayati TaxID=131215 RepID=A0ACC2NEY0_9HYME|nr:hypothetical protein QAD02_000911 [Eretmocerus hayati]